MIRVWAASTTGRVRDHNEDAVGINGWALQGDAPGPLEINLPADVVSCVCVCDGMGGYDGGEFASRRAADIVSRVSAGSWDAAGQESALAAALQRASDSLVAAQRSGPFPGMGTTAVVCALSPDGREAAIAHVGDSRAYLIEQGTMWLMTRDDRTDPEGSQLTQALGGRVLTELDVHTVVVPLRPASRILLCSDGVAGQVGDPDISGILTRYEDDGALAVTTLLEAANGAGGVDNATAVIIEVNEGADGPEVLDDPAADVVL